MESSASYQLSLNGSSSVRKGISKIRPTCPNLVNRSSRTLELPSLWELRRSSKRKFSFSCFLIFVCIWVHFILLLWHSLWIHLYPTLPCLVTSRNTCSSVVFLGKFFRAPIRESASLYSTDEKQPKKSSGPELLPTATSCSLSLALFFFLFEVELPKKTQGQIYSSPKKNPQDYFLFSRPQTR